jgi:ribosomal protein RSM22 (predicted rRNA methylase)
MSARYRAGDPSAVDALAYVAVRAPATYAAVRAVLTEVQERWPAFTPGSLLDVGAGPGTATWAACDAWPDLASCTLLERSPSFVEIGERLGRGSEQWSRTDVAVAAEWPAADLVVLAYVATELSRPVREAVVRRAFDATDEVLVVVEPGTPDGFRRLLEIRDVLLTARATVLAPCPHEGPCPLAGTGGWCHFSQRLARSRVHREVKRATAPWEEERYGYLVVTRSSVDRRVSRVLAPPKVSKGQIGLDLCRPNGRAVLTVRRSDKAGYATARKLRWGSGLPPGDPLAGAD